jgi:hypothetical protein
MERTNFAKFIGNIHFCFSSIVSFDNQHELDELKCFLHEKCPLSLERSLIESGEFCFDTQSPMAVLRCLIGLDQPYVFL